jgi:hypothetical protein
MDPGIAPLLLVAFGVGLWGTWTELRSSLNPVVCAECPHCRELLAARKREAEESARRQAELQSWYARRNRLDDDEEHRRRLD